MFLHVLSCSAELSMLLLTATSTTTCVHPCIECYHSIRNTMLILLILKQSQFFIAWIPQGVRDISFRAPGRC